MKYILSILIFALNSSFSFSQTTFEIKQLGTNYTQEQITQTFSIADFCGAYFVSKRNSIQLNDGAIVELKSQSELANSGITLPQSCVLADTIVYHSAAWSISAEGRLMKGLSPQLSPAEMKLNVIQH
jgi:hypothetical protein